jgi:hypothetical protein
MCHSSVVMAKWTPDLNKDDRQKLGLLAGANRLESSAALLIHFRDEPTCYSRVKRIFLTMFCGRVVNTTTASHSTSPGFKSRPGDRLS